MSVKVRNRLIVKKEGVFFRGLKYGNPEWTPSAYEAWYEPEGSQIFAQKVADKMGGVVRKFDPVTGEVS